MIKHIKTSDLRRMQNQEGLILQGCGGSLQEWVDGINQMLTEAEILKDGTKFKDADTFEHDGLTCLLFPFDNDVKLDVGKLAIWRLRTHENFGGTWLSDYVNNRLGGFTPENKLSFFCTLSGELASDQFDYADETEAVPRDVPGLETAKRKSYGDVCGLEENIIQLSIIAKKSPSKPKISASTP